MKIGITGTQKGGTLKQHEFCYEFLKSIITKEPNSEVHHGDCIGVDFEIVVMSEILGFKTICHPPENNKFRAYHPSNEIRKEKPYIKRNHDIVDEVDFLLVLPKGSKEELRSGTWATYRYAKKINREFQIIYP